MVNNFFDSLNPGGYLFIGHSESLTSICDRFETVEVDGVFLYRKPRARRHVSFDEVLAARQRRRRRSSGPVAIASDDSVSEQRPARRRPSSRYRESRRQRAHGRWGCREAYRLLEEGRPTEAREAADEALALDPASIEALIVRAYTHADDGDLDAAIDEARRVLEIDPLSASAYYILGLIYQRQGDQDAALDAFSARSTSTAISCLPISTSRISTSRAARSTMPAESTATR